MKYSIILVALALGLGLGLVPTAQAQETCRTYMQYSGSGTQLVLEANKAEGGCEAFLPGGGMTYKGATLEVFERPGSSRINGFVNMRVAKGVNVEKSLVAPPTASDTDSLPLSDTQNVQLRIILFDVAGTFSAKLTVTLGPPMPTSTPVGGTGGCGPGDFYCEYSGLYYTAQWDNLKVGGSEEGGSQTEIYPLGSHVAEPGAWLIRVWGCGSLPGTNRALSIAFLDNDGRDLGSLVVSGEIQTKLANSGLILHVPIPRDWDKYREDTARELYFRMSVGSFWPGSQAQYCSLYMRKIANNNFTRTDSGQELTVYTGRIGWGDGGLSYYYDFDSAAADGSTTMTVENDENWFETMIPGSTGAQCRSGNASSVVLNGNGTANINLRAFARFYCAAAGPVTMSRIKVTIGPYVVGASPTPSATRTATITPTPSATRTLQPASTATNTRTATVSPTASATNTPTLTVTGTRPIEAPCALHTTYNVPVAPGTVEIRLSIGIRFVVSDNPVFINVGSQAMEMLPGTYTWESESDIYTLYSLTDLARVLVCAGSAATPTLQFVPTETTIEDVCIPADRPPIGGGNQVFPDLSIPIPTWRPVATVEITITSGITNSVIITTVAQLRAGLSTPQAAIQTMAAPYSADSGIAFAATATTNMQPALNWFSVLNPQSWETSNNALWAIAPVVGPVIPLGVVWISTIIIRFIIWCVRWIIRIIELIPGM